MRLFSHDFFNTPASRGPLRTGALSDGAACGVYWLRPEDAADSYALHAQVADAYAKKMYVSKRSPERIAQLISGCGRGLAVRELAAGKLVAQRFFNSRPGKSDAPFLDLDSLDRPVAVGGSTTALERHGCGAIKMITLTMRDELPKYSDVGDLVTVTTFGNASSLTNALRPYLHGRVYAMGTLDGVRVVTSVANLKAPDELGTSDVRCVQNAMARPARVAYLLRKGFAGYGMTPSGALHFAPIARPGRGHHVRVLGQHERGASWPLCTAADRPAA
ncbi:MAG: hypothetical protein FWF01_00550 [Alphaproteobacteria bacterium]|nr:hypothetical protein [Alphaproteobacteria bacterium]